MTGRSYDAEPPRPRARTCAECGTQAGPDQSFCDGCGAVLGWAEPPAAGSARRPSEAPLSAAAAGAGPLPPAVSEGAGAAGAGGSAPPPSGGSPYAPPPSGGGSPYTPPGSGAGSGSGAGRSGAEGAGPMPPRAGEGTGGRGFGGGAGQDVIEDPGAKSAVPIGGTGGGQESWGEVPRQGQAPVAEWQAAAGGPAPGAGAGGPAAGGPVAGGPAPTSAPAPAPAPAPSDPGARTDPMEDTLEQPPATDPQYAQAQQPPQPQQPQQPGQPPQPQQPPQSPSAEERARALLVPVADPQQRPAAAPSVGAVMPGRPVASRPLVRTPGELPDDDGPAGCPWCQTGNRVERHFCRRCAMPMSGRPQDDLVRRSWWRRLLDFFRRREAPWAGERPRLRRNLGRVVTWLVGAGVAVLVVIGATHIGDGVRATQDHFAKRAPIVPSSESASRSYPGHPAKLAFDEYNNTWWGPGVVESGAGEWLEARFLQPVHLLDLVITPGESTQPADLQKSAEPHEMDVTVTTADGRTIVRHITLDQGSGGQTISFRATKVTSVRFTVRSSYGIDKKKQVAIAEIEFFGPKHAN